MASKGAKRIRASELPGVSGEFHSQGGLLRAVRTARRHGFPEHRVWLIGEPATDRVGDPIGFVMPASLVHEAGWAGLLIGVLFGLICAFQLPPKPFLAGLRLVLPWSLTAGVIAYATATLIAWAGLSARIGAYLTNARGGGLRLKITLPVEAPIEEQERLAEIAERALREAKAESLARLDGTIEINSPQSPAYLA